MHTLLTLTYFSCFVTIPLQWGFYVCNASQSYPIAFSINPYCIAASVLASTTDSNYYSISVDNDSNRSFILNGWRDNVKQGDIYAAVIAIGK
nr:MAG TPA: putative tail fiber protein [Caudoviricetes sp.]